MAEEKAGLEIRIENVAPVKAGVDREGAQNAQFDIRFCFISGGEVIHTIIWRNHLAYRSTKDGQPRMILQRSGTNRTFSQSELDRNVHRAYFNQMISFDSGLMKKIAAAIRVDPWINQFVTLVPSRLTAEASESQAQKVS
jgi:hypothetical protein